MKILIGFLLALFISGQAIADELNTCTPQEYNYVWDNLYNNNIRYNLNERVCFAERIGQYLNEVFIKDLPTLTPREKSWLDAELNYMTNDGSNTNRINKVINNEIYKRYEIFSVINNIKKDIKLIKSHAGNEILELQLWSLLVAHLLEDTLYDDYKYLADNNIITFNPKASIYSHLILPSILRKSVISINKYITLD